MAIVEEFALAMKFIYERALEIIRQPALNPEMLWMLIPMLVSLFLIELYFGRYSEEELGWNSAVSNALVLFFVGINLASWLYSNGMLVGFMPVDIAIFDIALKKTFIAAVVIAESALLLFLNFFHLVAKRFSFGISSGLIINFVGAISIILVYSDIPLDIATFPAVLLIFICLVLFFWIIRLIEPKAKEISEEENEE
ncbi:MAG: hypothetical protein N3G19_02900 [Candidatus Pacearchaeota archaeon]|nr:hypothetical protein [Candidatus Pacearchaeota archaeon]